MQGEEPSQREACLHQNRRHNALHCHVAGERDPTQLVSQDKTSEARETPYEQASREQWNSQ
jgi:hypothetical protein